MQSSTNNKHTAFYYWLDPLRALAAILVLLVHARSVMFETYGNLTPQSQNIFTILFFALCSLGGFAVCIFYILSGFLVGGKTIAKAKENKITPHRFFLDRLFRIGIPLTGALILICLTNTIIGAGIDWKQLLGQYLGLQCVVTEDYGGVFWTLPYEIWFYAIILAILLLCGRNRHLVTGYVLLVLSLTVFCALLPQFLYIIICGIICFFLKDYQMSAVLKRVFWIALIFLFSFYFIVHLHFLTASLSITNIAEKLKTPSQIALFTNLAILLSQYVKKAPENILSRIINSGGKKIATFSYSLFLTHFQILKIWQANVSPFNNIGIISILCFVLVCIVCVAVAYVFYYAFERNTHRIQTFIENKISQYYH